LKHLKRFFEDFTEDTLSTNNNTYDLYLKNNKKRSSKVAWIREGSQEDNFKLVSSHIENGDSLLDYGCGIGDLLSHLNKRRIQISDYLGVDINPNYIELANKKYEDREFKLISDIDQLSGNYDKVCAVGVFTWYIGKKDFIHAINKLYEMCNKEVLLTLLYGPWRFDDYWTSKYRYYKEDLFLELFPKLEKNFEFNVSDDRTLLVRIKK
jgi:cyclopropane fatty-acyl-phospholipid synthase-like methyltransferase